MYCNLWIKSVGEWRVHPKIPGSPAETSPDDLLEVSRAMRMLGISFFIEWLEKKGP